MGTYYIGSAICEPIADEKIVKLLAQMGDTFKVMLAILCSLSVMLIIFQEIDTMKKIMLIIQIIIIIIILLKELML